MPSDYTMISRRLLEAIRAAWLLARIGLRDRHAGSVRVNLSDLRQLRKEYEAHRGMIRAYVNSGL